MPEALALLVLGLAIALVLFVAATFATELASTRAAVRRSQIIVAEAERMRRVGEQIAEAQRVTESGVALGAQVVRTLHRGIAAIPFGILESIPVTRDTTRLVRASHDLVAGAVYDSIEAVNRAVGSQIRQQLDHETGGEGGVGDEPAGQLDAHRE